MRKRITKSNRAGAAVVEAALTLPLIFLIILGTVEICNGMFLKQSLTVMAFEGARVATLPDAQRSDIDDQVNLVAASRGVIVDTISVSPTDFANQTTGGFVEVKVLGSSSQYAGLFGDRQVEIAISMMKNH